MNNRSDEKCCGLQSKGQISVELLTTIGIIIAFTIPVLLLLLTVTQYGQENATMAQADATVKVIAENIEEIYFEGNGAKKALLINLPSNSKFLIVKEKEKEAVLNIQTSAGEYNAVAPFSGVLEIEYSQTGKTGLLTLIIENIDGKVQVYEPYD